MVRGGNGGANEAGRMEKRRQGGGQMRMGEWYGCKMEGRMRMGEWRNEDKGGANEDARMVRGGNGGANEDGRW